jgi:hypothetical protein
MTSEAVTALVERLEGNARFTSAFDDVPSRRFETRGSPRS